ncbi:MAG: AraC family transcriptional regulator [Rikenellaceae bacterium]
MKEFTKTSTTEPSIVRYTSTHNSGIEYTSLSRNAIGYVLRGEKLIYNGDRSLSVKQGDIFFLGKGIHYIENIVNDNFVFEQVVFFYTSEELEKIITAINISYNLSFSNTHVCSKCQRSNSIALPASRPLANLFINLNSYIKDGEFSHNPAAEGIKLTELIYFILAREENCLKNRVFNSIDTSRGVLEQVVYSHIFDDISVNELASLCNRSLTSFKKEFKRLFEYPPHQWFLRQRLSYSRMLLETTRKSISEIGNECTFPNTSHFIKLFKKFYGHTPASYRNIQHTLDVDHAPHDIAI